MKTNANAAVIERNENDGKRKEPVRMKSKTARMFVSAAMMVAAMVLWVITASPAWAAVPTYYLSYDLGQGPDIGPPLVTHGSTIGFNMDFAFTKFGAGSLNLSGVTSKSRHEAGGGASGQADFAQVFNPNAGTVEMWIAPNAAGSTLTDFQTLFTIGSTYNIVQAGANRDLIGVGFFNTELEARYRSSNNTVGGSDTLLFGAGNGATGVDTWAANEWHHVALSWGGTDVELYLDGTRIAMTGMPLAITDYGLAGAETDGRVFVIGGNDVGDSNFHGHFDDIVVWDYKKYTGLTYNIPNAPMGVATPEPTTTALSALGLIVVGLARRRRR